MKTERQKERVKAKLRVSGGLRKKEGRISAFTTKEPHETGRQGRPLFSFPFFSHLSDPNLSSSKSPLKKSKRPSFEKTK